MSPRRKAQRAGEALTKQKTLFLYQTERSAMSCVALWGKLGKKNSQIFSFDLSKWQLQLAAPTWEIGVRGKDVVL